MNIDILDNHYFPCLTPIRKLTNKANRINTDFVKTIFVRENCKSVNTFRSKKKYLGNTTKAVLSFVKLQESSTFFQAIN